MLASPEFRYAPPEPSALQKVGEWIARQYRAVRDFLRRTFRLRRPVGSARIGAVWAIAPYVLYGLLGAGLLLLIVFFARGLAGLDLRRLTKRRTRSRPLVEAAVLEPAETADAEPDAWIRVAQAHLAAGDVRKAYRAVYIAVLVHLDHMGAIRFERSRTNGEYIRALRSRPNLLELVRPITRAFDAHWYGNEPVSEAAYRRVLNVYERVKGLSG